MHPPSPPVVHRRVLVASALVALLGSGLVGCTGDDEPASETTTPSGTPAPPVAMDVSVDRVAGHLGRRARARVARQVQTTLQQYAEAAFLGDYPRRDFAAAFGDFTSGVVRQAARDREVLTGSAFANAESVIARKLVSRVSVLAPRGRPAGATARLRLALEVDAVPVTITGRLLLTPPMRGKGPQRREWRIFGYRVSSNASDAAATGGAG